MHIDIPKGYALIIWSDDFIHETYNIRMTGDIRMYTNSVFPFEMEFAPIHRSKDFTIKNHQLIARAGVIPLPEIFYHQKIVKWKGKCIRSWEKIEIEIRGASGGSGWSKPKSTNTLS